MNCSYYIRAQPACITTAQAITPKMFTIKKSAYNGGKVNK